MAKSPGTLGGSLSWLMEWCATGHSIKLSVRESTKFDIVAQTLVTGALGPALKLVYNSLHQEEISLRAHACARHHLAFV